MARPSSSCAHDDDRVRLPPASPPRNSKAEKKESTGRRLSLACRPYATRSSISYFDRYLSNAHTAEDEAVKNSIVSKSAKVVLALLWQNLFAPVFFKELFSAKWAPLRRRPKDKIDDGVTYGGHGWLRRRSVDSFFSAPRVRGDDAAGRRRQSLSSGRGDEDPAMIALRSDQVRAPPSTADALAHKSTVP